MSYSLPSAYRWLTAVAPQPRMIAEALKLYGTAETSGAANNPAILAWASEVGCADYRADATPWCGLFMAVVAQRAGKVVPAQPLWALDWRGFGSPSSAPALGDVLVFQRPGGGHVGLYIGEDASAFHVLGGNQGDSVCILRVGRDRLKAARRPAYAAMPASVRPMLLAAAGELSGDEA